MCVFIDVCTNKQIPQMAHWTDTGLPRRLVTDKFTRMHVCINPYKYIPPHTLAIPFKGEI